MKTILDLIAIEGEPLIVQALIEDIGCQQLEISERNALRLAEQIIKWAARREECRRHHPIRKWKF